MVFTCLGRVYTSVASQKLVFAFSGTLRWQLGCFEDIAQWLDGPCFEVEKLGFGCTNGKAPAILGMAENPHRALCFFYWN
jgi:hypothetical protein